MWRIWTSRLGGFWPGLLLLAAGFAVSPQPVLAQQQAEVSIEELRRQAEAGVPEARRELGIALMLRNGTTDLVEARRWLRLASEAGDAEAKNAYAGLLLNGAGGPIDASEGQRLLLEAAAEGSVGANFTLSMALRNGSASFPRDPVRAFTHMEAAARLVTGVGAPRIHWELGMMHLQGIGTPANAEVAYRWVSRAADAGGINGMISRAVMLATGEGVAEDDVAARSWYVRASELDDPLFAHALRGLGSMLVSGEGGERDVSRGIAYLRIAQAGNDENARILLERWRDLITPEVDREAWRIANEWMAEHMPSDD